MWSWFAARAACAGFCAQPSGYDFFPCLLRAGAIFLPCRIYMHKNTRRKGVTSMELKVFKDTLAAYGGRWETRQELSLIHI